MIFLSYFQFFSMVEKNQQEEPKLRVRILRANEIIGKVEQRVGGNRMFVKCTDGVTRNCRIPGRLRRALWIREDDFVIVKPWEFDNKKADILFKYNKNIIYQLEKRGMLKGIEDDSL
ncbi:MAG: translation initiation factor eIF-1A [Nanoarchaeota archaeon]|nr:translation initiation factor eIF-1A [Nanoarchaeota archaeon]